MKRLSLLASGLWASLVAAAPLAGRQDSNIDPVVLNFALTLEHLENVFYKQALANYTQEDFKKAGYSDTYYNNLKHIAYDEESHVKLLTGALQAAGVTPVSACEYQFPSTDVTSFITLSSIIEGVGTSAYLGGAPLITSKDYLTVAGSILVTEALHTSYQRAAIGEVPFPSPYGTPLDPTSVFSIAAPFIKNCPAGNPTLPFTPLPALTYNAGSAGTCEEPDCNPSAAIKKRDGWEQWSPASTSSAAPTTTASAAPTQMPPKPDNNGPPPPKPSQCKAPAGGAKPPADSTKAPAPEQTWQSWNGNGNGNGNGDGHHSNGPAPPSAGATVSFTATKPIPEGSYVTFVSGLNVVSVKGTVSGNDISATIPDVVAGQAYVFVTSADVEGKLDSSKIIAGPAIVEVNPAPPTYDPNYRK